MVMFICFYLFFYLFVLYIIVLPKQNTNVCKHVDKNRRLVEASNLRANKT